MHGFAEFFEENVKEIFKHGSFKLEETPWSDGYSLSFAISGAWVLCMAQILAPYSSLLKKYLIHKGIEAEVESMKVLSLSLPKIEAI